MFCFVFLIYFLAHRTIICRFCGGRSCKREDYKKQIEYVIYTNYIQSYINAFTTHINTIHIMQTHKQRHYHIVSNKAAQTNNNVE